MSNLAREQHLQMGLTREFLACAGISNIESAEKTEAALDTQAQQEEEEEARQEGHVKAHVYVAYGRAAGWTIMAVLAVSIIIMQVTTHTLVIPLLLSQQR